jgi:hypothetical protein
MHNRMAPIKIAALILTSILDGGEWLASLLSHFTAEKEAQCLWIVTLSGS